MAHEHKKVDLKNCTPDEAELIELSELFKVFGDVTRLKILFALSNEEKCVGDIADDLGISQSAISHQLKPLKQSRLIKSRREGKLIFYSLADDHVSTMIAQGLEHVNED